MPRWRRARPESWWWVSAVVLIPVAVLTGLAALLLITTTHPTNAGDQIDLVKTALSVGAGTGGVVALVLAGRRQWHAEQAQQATERSHREAEHDATERRITELYTKAADQLGADKAPVRLAGLYALERLAQDNPAHRQTIVNLLCAYLRMPYRLLPDQQPNTDASEVEREQFEQGKQEREVRLTAQLILTAHLYARNDEQSGDNYWPRIDVDLTGAVLIDFDFRNCQVRRGIFGRARFSGDARFDRANFGSEARFSGAKFDDYARFDSAEFSGFARFDSAEFGAGASFRSAEFDGGTRFSASRFGDDVWFEKVKFKSGVVWFGRSEFGGLAVFSDAEFSHNVMFNRAKFSDGAWFDGVKFGANNWWSSTEFSSSVSFDRVTFAKMGFNVHDGNGSTCWVRLDVDSEYETRSWPSGWRVVPTQKRPQDVNVGQWGLLEPVVTVR